MAKVSITKVEKNLYVAVIKAIDDLGKQVVAPGDCVQIKKRDRGNGVGGLSSCPRGAV